MNKALRMFLLAEVLSAGAGFSTGIKLPKPEQPKVVTDFDREQLAKAQAKREKKAARNLKIGRDM